jgi:hypothetical protein
MTCDRIDSQNWRLSFPEPEAVFIINILARLGRHYQENVAQMSPALRAYWQGPLARGEVKDKAALKESEEVLAEGRAELRSERLGLVENWIREFEIAETREPWAVEVTHEERDEFIAMLNDRRLLLAFELGITEEEMTKDPNEIAEEARRHAILEIDILGHFILVMLGPQIYRP